MAAFDLKQLLASFVVLIVSCSGVYARGADCLLEIDGKTYVDGTCNFELCPGHGSFQISTVRSGNLEYLAQVDVIDPDRAVGRWSGSGGTGRISLGELAPAGACWVNARARICAWKLGERRYFVDRPSLSPTSTSEVPRRVGECVQTVISSLGSRLEGTPESGSAVGYANGLYGVSYEIVEALRESRVGDRVALCLVSVPTGCPKGDDRGRVYSAINSRTGRGWSLPDSQHMCGGA